MTIPARTGRTQQMRAPLTLRPAMVQSAAVDAQHDRPIRKNHRAPVVLNNSVPAGVSHLRSGSRPCAVFRRVAGVIVLPVKRVSRGRARPHVGHVVLEPLRPAPTVANRDSSRAVVLEVFVLRVVASQDHVPPTIPVGSPRCAVGAVHLRRAFAGYFFAVTPARSREPVSDVVRVDGLFGPARTPEDPSGFPVWRVLGTRDCRQAAEGLSGDVECFGHSTQHKSSLVPFGQKVTGLS